mmetsp:Transcript_6275/g.26675  ORF Transcript_6275/g.26675 Transcript_6275/m.26675 type:complete len:251 (-) Transcript_6275:487-1239(-)
MPFLASKRGVLRSPLSTTRRTPGIVSELSAMGVLTTTRLEPGGAALSAEAWSSRDKPPCSGKTSSGLTRGSFLRNAATASLISLAPGRNTKISPPSAWGCSSKAMPTALTTAFCRSNRPRPGAPTYSVRTGNARPSLATSGARFFFFRSVALSEYADVSLDPSKSAAAGPTCPSVADITTSRRSGRSAARTSVASARHRSASRLRSWNSSNTTALTFSNPGSCCSRRASMPSVTTSILVSRLILESKRTR